MSSEIKYCYLDSGARVDAWVFAKYGHIHWMIDRNGYHFRCRTAEEERTTNLPQRVYLHHVVLGKPPKGMQTDHINHDKNDNTEANLRFVTPSQNRINTPPKKGKFKGVFEENGKLRSRYRGLDGVLRSCGTFLKTEWKKAGHAYDMAVLEIRGPEHPFFNFPRLLNNKKALALKAMWYRRNKKKAYAL